MEMVRSFSVLRESDSDTPPVRHVWVSAYTQDPHDGTIACGYSDGCVALWDMRDTRERRLVYAPDPDGSAYAYDGVLSVAFSPDGTLLASANHGRSPDRAAHVWDVRTGKLVHRLGGFRYRLHDAAFSPDGQALALAGDDHLVKLYDMATGDERPPAFARLPSAVSALAFSPDGRYLVAGCDDELLVIYEPATGAETGRQLEGHLEWTTALAFHPQGRLFASGGEDGLVWLWEAESGRRVREFHRHDAPDAWWDGRIHTVTFSLDGALLASTSGKMRARLWEVATGREIAMLAHPPRDVHDDLSWIAFQPHDNELLTGTTNGQVSLWRASKPEP